MVQHYEQVSSYPDPPVQTLIAFFNRYPNPHARHVLSVDVLDRYIDPLTGRLHTKRLILKRGILPKWAAKWLLTAGRGLDAWVMEESVVDPPGWGENSASSSTSSANNASTSWLNGGASDKGKSPEKGDWNLWTAAPRLRMVQGNLNHKKFMHVVEGGELRAAVDNRTDHVTTAEIRSDFGGAWSKLLRDRIEAQGVGRFAKNTERARQGMVLILDEMRAGRSLSDISESFSSLSFGEAWLKARGKSNPIAVVAGQEQPRQQGQQSEKSEGGIWSRWRRKGDQGDDFEEDG